jgi:hypothetical protein
MSSARDPFDHERLVTEMRVNDYSRAGEVTMSGIALMNSLASRAHSRHSRISAPTPTAMICEAGPFCFEEARQHCTFQTTWTTPAIWHSRFECTLWV